MTFLGGVGGILLCILLFGVLKILVSCQGAMVFVEGSHKMEMWSL